MTALALMALALPGQVGTDDPETFRLVMLHDRLTLLANQRVQEELKLRPEAAASVSLLVKTLAEGWKPDELKPGRDTMLGPLRKDAGEVAKTLDELTDPAQRLRLDQLLQHRWDLRSLRFPVTQAALGISETQRSDLLKRFAATSVQAAAEKARNTLPRDQFLREYKRLGEDYRANIRAVLDAGQAAKWEALRGPKPSYPVDDFHIPSVFRQLQAAPRRPPEIPLDHPVMVVGYAGVLEALGLAARDADRTSRPRRNLEKAIVEHGAGLAPTWRVQLEGQTSVLEQELGPAAWRRLRQLIWQAAGANAALNPELGKVLGVTVEQKRTAAAGVAAATKGMGRPGARPAKEMIADAHAAMMAALTDDQRRKFAELLGEPASDAVLNAIRRHTPRD